MIIFITFWSQQIRYYSAILWIFRQAFLGVTCTNGILVARTEQLNCFHCALFSCTRKHLLHFIMVQNERHLQFWTQLMFMWIEIYSWEINQGKKIQLKAKTKMVHLQFYFPVPKNLFLSVISESVWRFPKLYVTLSFLPPLRARCALGWSWRHASGTISSIKHFLS